MLSSGRAEAYIQRMTSTPMRSAAYAILLTEIAFGVLPMTAWIAALPAALSFTAAQQLLQFAELPSRLVLAIQLTILAALSHALLLSIAVFPLWRTA